VLWRNEEDGVKALHWLTPVIVALNIRAGEKNGTCGIDRQCRNWYCNNALLE